MIVKLRSGNSDYADLSADQFYFVIGIEADDYRILNDAGKPYLYPPELFDIIEATIPTGWITDIGTDGERYAYAAPLNQAGFFEDLLDQKPEQMSIFWGIVNRTPSKVT
jgi:hypothetical protein